LISGQAPARYGNAHPNIVPYEAFQASDQYIALGIGNDAQWAKFCQSIEHSDWALDERFATNQARVEHRELLIPMLQAIFLQNTAAAWLNILEDAGIPAAPINAIDQVFSDPQIQARNMAIHMPHACGRTIPMVASPLKIPTSPVEPRYAPPILGQSTEEILTGLLGYDAETIQSLRASRII
jgi:crotonobetainyl-CoA:carnitine CoA-transferase CaiB-like acyl-CoA transferase